MDREQGLHILTENGWLSTAPRDFQRAVLAHCRWQSVEAGTRIQKTGELIGLAQGTLAMRTVLAADDTPLIHIEHAVSWFGYEPIIGSKPRTIAAKAQTQAWMARAPQRLILRALDERPEWWRQFLQLQRAVNDNDVTIAADLLIRSSERRCAAVLLRLAGHRFAESTQNMPVEVPITQNMLGAAANLSRNSAGTALRKLVLRELVELGHHRIVVRSPTALRTFVDSV